ncbi:hypothetical protein C7271_13530 [filamentous cyanobacterium CCP5]|nr:hypothetical protein C7271_13530 [filamentous cyanobacterium CCP5]
MLKSIPSTSPKLPMPDDFSLTPMTSAAVQLQIYVEIVDSDPAIWRRLRIPAKATLQDLHQLLQAAMGWHNRHDHQFKTEASEQATVTAVFSQDIPELLYLYDRSDGWLHRVRLEQTLSMPDGPAPVCLEGEMACPLEGSGGVWGYEELLDRLNDPDDPEYVDLWDRIGGDFDPDYFDLSAANQRLSALAH